MARPRLSRSVFEKDPADMTAEELTELQDRMESQTTVYTARDLEQAKNWLQRKPHLRAHFGKDYYDFAVQVASVIHQGQDPETIDWASLDRQIGVRDALAEERRGWMMEKALHKQLYRSQVERYVRKEHDHVCRANKLPLTVEKAEKNINEIIDYIMESVYQESFDGMSAEDSNNIALYLVRAAANEWAEDKVLRYLERKGMSQAQARNVYRTERHELKNKIREYAFLKNDPEGVAKYKWGGPDDHRTTTLCKNVTERADRGVTMDELKQILQDEVDAAKARGELPRDFDMRDWTPHFGCRHTFWKAF